MDVLGRKPRWQISWESATEAEPKIMPGSSIASAPVLVGWFGALRPDALRRGHAASDVRPTAKRVVSVCCCWIFDYCVTRTAGVIAKSLGVRSAMSCANRPKMALVVSAPSLGTQ